MLFRRLVLSSLLAASPLFAQSSAGSPPSQPAYTFHAGTRVVLTDVMVTDKHGNPVPGLKQSDFAIYDDNKPQAIASFEEHTTTPAVSLPRVSIAPGVYSNAFLQHLPPVLNIIVLDTTNLEIADQMYLDYQLTRFIQALPVGEPLAIYWKSGPSSFLLQSFTFDHALLLAAIHKALPHFPPFARQYYSDFATLHQIAVTFGQYPGRKNVLWFSGGSTLYLNPDPTRLPTMDRWRLIYDELESSRIAIYPVDARGLIVLSRIPFALWSQHALMNDIAQTTGGAAYYNTSGFGQIAQQWLHHSGDFYTITYSPRNFRVDDKWHKVKVKLSSNLLHYTLSYRRGYFADSLANQTPHQKPSSRTLLAGGTSAVVPDLRSVPLVFQATIIPASQAHISLMENTSAAEAAPRKGTIPYAIHYTIPFNELTPVAIHGKQHIQFNVAAFSFDKDGAEVTRLGTSVSFDINLDKLRQFQLKTLPFDQRINLRKGQNYLYLAIWDTYSGRLGTLQIPFEAAKPK